MSVADKNRDIARIKSTLDPRCFICKRPGVIEAAHILPRSTSPEHYTNHMNIVGLCHECHTKFDNSLEFRQKQTAIRVIAESIDKQASYRRFRL
ncbi:HNH endonuclease [Bacteroides sp.]|uniref:HNH endonuclease n=1 Tax=Bacteroides sp. TaxID=29523 RepID=UPI003FA57677